MSSVPVVLQNKPLHESVRPIGWLIGQWIASTGKGQYPNISPFSYCEQIEFSSLGQPILNYTAYSWHPEKQNAMHLETGFLRIKPGTQRLAFMVAHNFGLTSVEEGVVQEHTVSLTSTQISRMSFAKDPQVTKVVRKFTLVDHETLKQEMEMETDKQPLAHHLDIVYKKAS